MQRSTDFGGGVGGKATAHMVFSGLLILAPRTIRNTHPMQSRGAKSFVDDLVFCRGVVLSRAAASLRSIETKPFDWEICLLWTDTSPAGCSWRSLFKRRQGGICGTSPTFPPWVGLG